MRKLTFTLLIALLCICEAWAQEKIFADYFDIKTNSTAGTPVVGSIHLERNKDVIFTKIPASYHFEIVDQKTDLFGIRTHFDGAGRITGVLYVEDGKTTGSDETKHLLRVALMDGATTLNEVDIVINVLNKTLWELFYSRYMQTVPGISRLYGKRKVSDKEISAMIDELERNDGRFEGFKCYDTTPEDFPALHANAVYEGKLRKDVTIDFQWINIVDKIGGLGYGYYFSKVYGIKGNPEKHEHLKQVLCKALNTYMASVPIEGHEVTVKGKPIGKYTGDATSLLSSYNLAWANNFEHHWRFTDPLILPVLTLMPDVVEGVNKNEKQYVELHENMIRYFQLFTAIVQGRRAITNNPRWGEIVDTCYSEGAWADANLGHRSRTMLSLPLIWADYNRPMTYVQYWYKDFYNDKPFKDFSFSPGWSPSGVVKDVSRWMTKYCIPSHHYAQSGFHPDGTISHHIGHGTDAAMVAYGFEWLTDCSNGYAYFKDTKYEVDSKNYQFQLDRLLNVYPKFFYKGYMDFLISGRTYLSDLNEFVNKTYIKAIKNLDKARSDKTKLEGMDKLKKVGRKLKSGEFEYSGTTAYWVNEFLIHRRGENETPFYASVKLKSKRTVGIEDFSKPRKSWYGGYGILQVKVKGDEYDQQVLENMDWHALPGLTEEWRTDPQPVPGGAQASLPGNNEISGVLSDNTFGMAMYHHLPGETYSSAQALKSYHFIDDRIMALGSNVQRLRSGQQKEIHTFVDQTEFYDELTWCINGKKSSLKPGESVVLSFDLKKPSWLHMGKKGYILIPDKKSVVTIRTGKEINVTDRAIADDVPNMIISINHGMNPCKEGLDNDYLFYQIPNVTAKDMAQLMKSVQKEISVLRKDSVHAVYSNKEKIHQFAFYAPGKVELAGMEVESDDVAMIMLKENDKDWTLSMGNPMPDGVKQTLRFVTNVNLPEGEYRYQVGGVYPLEGETVSVKRIGDKTEVIAQIPDRRDEKRYNYQTDLYASTPIVVRISK